MNKPAVAVLDDYAGAALGLANWSPVRTKADITVFDRHLTEDEAAEVLQSFDVLCTLRERMEVVAWSQNLTAEAAAAAGARLVGKETLFRESDVVSIHVVLSERTRGPVAGPELALMKPSAYLINTSRGPIVDETALITALKNGQIAGAPWSRGWTERRFVL